MKTRVRKTLLQSLMIERHLTREQVIEVLDRRARDMGVRDFALSACASSIGGWPETSRPCRGLPCAESSRRSSAIQCSDCSP